MHDLGDGCEDVLEVDHGQHTEDEVSNWKHRPSISRGKGKNCCQRQGWCIIVDWNTRNPSW